LTKLLEATCEAQVVKVGTATVSGAQILSEGVAASTGLLFLDGPKSKYVTSSASDVKALITSMVSILDKCLEILTGLDGASTSPGSQSAKIVELTTLKTQLNTSKDNLK